MQRYLRLFCQFLSLLVFLWNAVSFFPASFVFAQGQSLTAPYSVPTVTIAGIVNSAVQLVFGTAIVVCVVFLVVFSIKYITAGDDTKKITGARKGLTGVVIGLIIVISTFTIIKVVAVLLGADSGKIFSILPTSLGLSNVQY